MRLIRLLFSPHGVIGRVPFLLALLAIAALFALGIQTSLAALPWLAQVLSPRGINAGFALNTIWSILGLGLVWSSIALTAKRLRARGRWPWWGAAAIIPLAALALRNDAIFLVSRSVVVPVALQIAIAVIAGAIGLWVLIESLRPAATD